MNTRSAWPLNGDEILRRDWGDESVTRADLCRSLGVSPETMYKKARALELSSRRQPGRTFRTKNAQAAAPRPGIQDAIGYDLEDRRMAANAIEGTQGLLERLRKFHNIDDVVNV